MEWAQVLAIVVPVMLTIVIGVIYNNKRIDDLRLDMDKRFAAVDGRFIELKGEMNSRFTEVHDEVKADTDRRFTEVHDELKEMKADIREIRQFLLRLIPIPEPPKENPR
jgi:hypothetical protein